MQIGDYLYQKKMYELLSWKDPEKMEQEIWDLLDFQALGVVHLIFGEERGFQHHQKEDHRGPYEGTITYVQETIYLEQGVFDASSI